MGLLAEAGLRVALTFVLPIRAFLVVSQVIVTTTTVVLIAWTMAYSRHIARRGAARAAATVSG